MSKMLLDVKEEVITGTTTNSDMLPLRAHKRVSSTAVGDALHSTNIDARARERAEEQHLLQETWSRSRLLRIMSLVAEIVNYVMSLALVIVQLNHWNVAAEIVAWIRCVPLAFTLVVVILGIYYDPEIFIGLKNIRLGWLEYARVAMIVTQFALSLAIAFVWGRRRYATAAKKNMYDGVLDALTSASIVVANLMALPSIVRDATGLALNDHILSAVKVF